VTPVRAVIARVPGEVRYPAVVAAARRRKAWWGTSMTHSGILDMLQVAEKQLQT